MGNYFNPSNEGYEQIKNSEIYIDKTGLIAFLNKRLSTEDKCIAVSHARRFGKSHAARMIDAYYSRGCDSSKIFEGTKITQNLDFKKHLNKYNVIHLDISTIWDFHKEDIIEEIIRRIYKDLKEEYSSKLELNYQESIDSLLLTIYNKTQIPFVIIIDEWDCVIRNSDSKELVHRYLQFLHALFKSNESSLFLALGYITGILPIKKIKDESALNNFEEFTMLDSYPITEYYGFTDEEVKELCIQYDMDYDSMKEWYDGYCIDDKRMSNPNSVVMAIKKRKYNSYWKNTSAYETINRFISMDYKNLKQDITSLLEEKHNKITVNTENFLNDFNSVKSKNDALTALIHLGYLAYDSDRKKAYIPNYEVRTAFRSAIENGSWKEIADLLVNCDDLLDATIEGDAQKVADLIEFAHAHDSYTSSLKYNDENSLSCVITMAYFTAPAYYNVIREFPTGKGFADFVFIPRANAGDRPAMIVELKYDKSAKTAIDQIKNKNYPRALSGYKGKILLVGINYDPKVNDKDKKKHTCIIEEYKA